MPLHRKTFLLCGSIILVLLVIWAVVFYSLPGKPDPTDINKSRFDRSYGFDSEESWLDFVNQLKAAPSQNALHDAIDVRAIDARAGWDPWNKSSEEVRIVVLGDSFTFGYGVEENETFPAILQESLRRALSENLTVINLGVRGYGTQQEYELYRYVGVEYNPDIVILALNRNDWEDTRLSHPHDTALSGLREGLIESEVGWMHGLGVRMQSLQKQKYYRTISLEDQWELVEPPLKGIIENAPQGCFVLVHDFYYPTSVDFPQGPERIGVLQNTHGIHVLSLSQFYDAHQAEEVTLPNDDHPNAFAHAGVAALIAESLLNSSLREECLLR